jgi:hypothetical protein
VPEGERVGAVRAFVLDLGYVGKNDMVGLSVRGFRVVE